MRCKFVVRVGCGLSTWPGQNCMCTCVPVWDALRGFLRSGCWAPCLACLGRGRGWGVGGEGVLGKRGEGGSSSGLSVEAGPAFLSFHSPHHWPLP